MIVCWNSLDFSGSFRGGCASNGHKIIQGNVGLWLHTGRTTASTFHQPFCRYLHRLHYLHHRHHQCHNHHNTSNRWRQRNLYRHGPGISLSTVLYVCWSDVCLSLRALFASASTSPSCLVLVLHTLSAPPQQALQLLFSKNVLAAERADLQLAVAKSCQLETNCTAPNWLKYQLMVTML